MVREGRVTPAPVVSITLAADHRVTDGHAGSRFLAEIARWLEDPSALFEQKRSREEAGDVATIGSSR